MSPAATRLPTHFISHGGGPWPWIKDLMPMDFGPLEKSLQDITKDLGLRPKAILVISGHWEEAEFTVQTSARPPMVYDYGGFPDFTYQIQYPAPGSPEVAARVSELLSGAGITVRQNGQRGYDHGVFAPLFAMYPDADVPILQLSLKNGYDPASHLAVGRALAPLRDEGVLIVGSGLSYHNLRNFGPGAGPASKAFDDWLTHAVVESAPAQRTTLLLDWERAPSARAAHPAEDHLIPLMVVAGAAEAEAASITYHEDNFGGSVSASSYRFGPNPAAA